MHSAEHFRTLVMLNMHLLLVIKLLNHLNRVSSKRVQKLKRKTKYHKNRLSDCSHPYIWMSVCRPI